MAERRLDTCTFRMELESSDGAAYRIFADALAAGDATTQGMLSTLFWEPLVRFCGGFGVYRRVTAWLDGRGFVQVRFERISRADAEELTNDVLHKAMRSFDPLRAPDMVRLQAWMYTIARNRCTDWIRAQKARHQEPPLSDLLHRLPAGITGPQLLACVRELPLALRSFFWLRYGECRDMNDIAAGLECSRATVYRLEQRLKDAIQRCLAPRPPDGPATGPGSDAAEAR